MAIPPFTSSGVLPPFIGNPAVGAAGRSPYLADLPELVNRFGTSPKRRTILRGLVSYRAALRAVGITSGFQWLDGSFVEEKEPNDIDVVTFSPFEPELSPAVLALFTPPQTKAAYLCDGYFVHLSQEDQPSLISQAAYWFGLFTHRRATFEWKGIVQVALDDVTHDAAAAALLDQAEGKP